jgi:hypothetical protein
VALAAQLLQQHRRHRVGVPHVAREHHVERRDVAADRVAGDVARHVTGRDVPAGPPDHDRELGLVVERGRRGGAHDRILRPDERRDGLGEQHRHGPLLARRRLAVVAPDAHDVHRPRHRRTQAHAGAGQPVRRRRRDELRDHRRDVVPQPEDRVHVRHGDAEAPQQRGERDEVLPVDDRRPLRAARPEADQPHLTGSARRRRFSP